jgi:hypothetical protein
MASALSNAFLNIVDAAKKVDPNGNIAQMVELLAKKNAFLQDIPFQQGNLPMGHKFSGRMALPTPSWRSINQGIDASKSQADSFEEKAGMLEGLSKVDVALAELYGSGAAAFRADEDNSFFTAFGIEVARALFYESTDVNPDKIHGLTPRFDGTGVAAAQFISGDAGSTTGQRSSIWLVGWAPDTVFGFYPKSGVAGFQTEDLGKQIVKDSNSKEYVAYVSHHKWALGLCVKDYRQVVRVGNLQLSRLDAAGTNCKLWQVLQDAVAAVYDTDTVSPVFYMNRQIFSALNKQLFEKSANLLEYIERGGRRIPHFLGIPIRISDALHNLET